MAGNFGFVTIVVADATAAFAHDDSNGVPHALAKSRLLATGSSAGGHLAQRHTRANPEEVAAVAVLSAVAYDQLETRAKTIPLLIALGDGDHPGGVEQAQPLAQDLQQACFKTELHILPGVGYTMSNDARELTLAFFKSTTA